MNKSVFVNMVETVANLKHDVQLIGERDALPAFDDVREIRSLKKLHGDECYGLEAHIVETDHVGVIELAPDSAGAEKAVPVEGRNADVIRDFLEGHVPVIQRIVSLVEFTDRSLAYGLQNSVPPNLLRT